MYGTVQDANDWLSARGKGPITEAQLEVAGDYLDVVYGHRFPGVPTGDDAWPRDGATDCCGQDIDGVPDAVKHAAYLLADSGIAEGGATIVPRGAVSVTEGALSVTFGQSGAPTGLDALPTLPLVDAMLACLLVPGIGIVAV